MKNILILSTILLASAVAGLADPVAVFDVQWGKGKDRQKRSFAIGFYDADAPRTSANFKKLVQDGFYKKTTIHRVFPNYLVQGGDPLSKNKDRSAVGTGGNIFAERWPWAACRTISTRIGNPMGANFMSVSRPCLPRTVRILSLAR
jgi:hypothetical protein